MNDYISRKALLDWVHEFYPEDKVFASAIINAPAADVAPVRHAKWSVNVGMNFFKERNCPVCKKRIESNFWNYCPNCGAKMDGVDDE